MKFILILALLWSTPAWAATYYVGKAPGTNSNSCATATSSSAANRKLTITGSSGGLSCLSAGDTLVVGNGDWNELITNTNIPSGTSGAPTIIKSENARLAVIKYSGQQVPVNISNRNWVTFRDFKVDGALSPSNATHGLIDSGSTNILFDNLEVTGFVRSGFVVQGTNTIVRNSWSHINGRPPEILPGNGLYAQGNSSLIEDNIFEFNSDAGITGIEPASGPKTGVVVRRNIFRSNGKYGISTRSTVFSGIYNNIFATNSTVSSGFSTLLLAQAGNVVYNNTLWDNNATCIVISGGTTSVVRNNICYQNNSDTVTNTPGGNTISNNLLGTNPLFANTATGNFRLLSGSPAINAGLAGAHCSGQNGTSGCTQGAYDPPRFLSCRVADGDPNTIRVTFSNNRYAPILTGAVTGITISVNGDSRTESAPTVMGTNLIHYTIDGTPIINGQTVTWAAASTNTVTDSANIGGTVAGQSLHTWSAQACTNEVAGGGPAGTWDLKVFSFRDVHGTEPLAPKKPFAAAPNSTPIRIIVGGSVRIRTAIIRNTADTLIVTPKLYCKWNAGSYFAVPSTFDSNNVKIGGLSNDPDIPPDQTATTNLLGAVGAGSFVPGLFIRTSDAIPSITIAPTNWTEMEWLLNLDTDVTPGDVLTCEVRDQDGTVLNASPTTRPTATVINQFAAG